MSEIKLLLDGSPLTVGIDGVIRGEHEFVDMCNAKVAHTLYTPSRQQTAVTLLQRLGARLAAENVQQVLAYPVDFDPFIWY